MCIFFYYYLLMIEIPQIFRKNIYYFISLDTELSWTLLSQTKICIYWLLKTEHQSCNVFSSAANNSVRVFYHPLVVLK